MNCAHIFTPFAIISHDLWWKISENNNKHPHKPLGSPNMSICHWRVTASYRSNSIFARLIHSNSVAPFDRICLHIQIECRWSHRGTSVMWWLSDAIRVECDFNQSMNNHDLTINQSTFSLVFNVDRSVYHRRPHTWWYCISFQPNWPRTAAGEQILNTCCGVIKCARSIHHLRGAGALWWSHRENLLFCVCVCLCVFMCTYVDKTRIISHANYIHLHLGRRICIPCR